ncbi:MAG: DUF4190 domain-containing protein [Propionicimonas sp.]|nr:DUF4190 domain-containing protein [Propionicimonas sp.]
MTDPWARPEGTPPDPGQTPDQAETVPLVPQDGYPQRAQGGWPEPEPTTVDPFAQAAPYTNPTPSRPAAQQQVFPTYSPPPASPYPPVEPSGTPGYAPYGQPSGFQAGQVVPAYGSPYGYPASQPEHPNAVPALILGILGFFTAITWPIAWYLGAKGRSEMRREPQRWRSSGMLTAGWVMGIIGTILMALIIGVVILVVLLAIASA